MARIFAALWPPDDVVLHLDEYVDAVRSARTDLRWVPAAHWHLTLEFLGECGTREIDRLLDRWAERARRVGPLTLRLRGAGAFPAAWTARVLWAGLEVEAGWWHALAGDQQEPHVALARTAQRTDLAALVGDLTAYAGPTWTADTLTIVRSHLRRAGDRGPRYEPIESFPLGRRRGCQDPSSD